MKTFRSGYGSPLRADRFTRAYAVKGAKHRNVFDFAMHSGPPKKRCELLFHHVLGGGLHGSRTLGQRLQAAEQELEGLRATPAQPVQEQIEHLIPRLLDRWQQFVGNFEKRILPKDIPVFRQEIGRYIGPIRVRATPSEILLEAQEGHAEFAFLRAAGLKDADQQISVVAGRDFDLSHAAAAIFSVASATCLPQWPPIVLRLNEIGREGRYLRRGNGYLTFDHRLRQAGVQADLGAVEL